LPFVITANAAVGRTWAGHSIGILCGLTAGVTFLVGALDLAGAGLLQVGGGQAWAVDIGIMVTAVVAATLASRPVREQVARVLAIDPDSPVHAYALVLAVIFFGAQLSSIVFVDLLTIDQAQPPLAVGDLVAQETPFLIMAVAGVGLYIRRDAAAAADRLGLIRPAWWHIVLALAAAGAFFALVQQADALSHQLSPAVAHRVDQTTQHLFGALNNPLGIAALAFLPGICEEILFRGALQPRIGLLATALLFTSIHTQYGVSLDTASIFIVAIGLGLIRKYTNTTSSMLCHVSYNLLAGVGIADSQIPAAAAIELVLAGVSVYGIWSQRRRRSVPVEP
jgi:membrane protease YdiL (CAAX protease family)